MKTLGLTLVLLGFVLAAVPATAQDAGQTSFTLTTHTEGGGGYFTLEGQTAKNPTLVVPASTAITITMKGSDDGVHNIQVDGSAASDYVQSAADSVTYTFTSPASGSKGYWCVPHKGAGMAGTVQVAGSAQPTPPATDGEAKDSPGIATIGVLVAALGVALVVGRRKA